MQREKLKKFLLQMKDIGFTDVPNLHKKIKNEKLKMKNKEQKIEEVGNNKKYVPSDKTELLKELRKRYSACNDCPLSKSRTKIVFGEGRPDADLMFIGEGPGFDEDHQGRPFVGRAGQLLTKILVDGMRIKRGDVYITNIVKCHPMKDPSNPEKRGNDRPPDFLEVQKCFHILLSQIRIIRPKVICSLGSPASKMILGKDTGISQIRGQIFEIKILPGDPLYTVKVVPTFHPAYLLRNPPAKKDAWADIKVIMDLLGMRTG